MERRRSSPRYVGAWYAKAHGREGIAGAACGPALGRRGRRPLSVAAAVVGLPSVPLARRPYATVGGASCECRGLVDSTKADESRRRS